MSYQQAASLKLQPYKLPQLVYIHNTLSCISFARDDYFKAREKMDLTIHKTNLENRNPNKTTLGIRSFQLASKKIIHESEQAIQG